MNNNNTGIWVLEKEDRHLPFSHNHHLPPLFLPVLVSWLCAAGCVLYLCSFDIFKDPKDRLGRARPYTPVNRAQAHKSSRLTAEATELEVFSPNNGSKHKQSSRVTPEAPSFLVSHKKHQVSRVNAWSTTIVLVSHKNAQSLRVTPRAPNKPFS